MKHRRLIIILILISITSYGQEFTAQFDHQALLVNDLDKSATFYTDVLRLKEIETPIDNPQIRWFSMGNNLQLHLIEGVAPEMNNYKAVHLALTISELSALIAMLESFNIPYSDWPGKQYSVSDRGDGVSQIYFQDPNGYWIEANNAKY